MKLAKKILLGLAILILLIISSGVIIAVFYGDTVKEYVLKEINKHLNAEINVSEVNFSVLQKFPYASLEFVDLTALDAIPEKKNKDTLFKAERFYLQFNLVDILNKKYRIRKIEINKGFSRLNIDKKGKDNFHFWKNSPDSIANNTQFSLALKEVIVRKFRASYQNQLMNQDVNLDINYTILNGNFSNEEFDLAIETKFFAESVFFNHTAYLKKQLVELSSVLKVRSPENYYEVKEGLLSIADLHFGIEGNFSAGNSTTLDLIIKGQNIEIQSLFSLLPAQYKEYVKDYDSKGNFHFNAFLKGTVSETENPSFVADFGINNGEVYQRSSDIRLEKINLKGKYTNGNQKKPETTKLEIEGLSCQMGSGKITGDFEVENFLNPSIKLSTFSELQLSELKEFIQSDSIEMLEGRLKIDAAFSGKIRSFNNYTIDDFKNSKTSGNLQFEAVNFKLKELPHAYTNLNGSFLFDNNDIIITSFAGNILNSNFELKGFFRNVISYLFIEDQKLVVDASLKSSNLDLNELLTSTSTSSASDTSYALGFSKNANFYLSVDIEKLNFRKFDASMIKGQISLKNEKLLADGLSFNALDGKINTTGYIDASDAENILISCDANIDRIDIQKLFYQFENFGQTTLVDKNLKGIATANIQFVSVVNSKLDVYPDKLYTKADLTIEKGELIQFEPMKNLSSFISVEDLEHIRFSYLRNIIEIRDQKITIPKTEILSSAMNLTFSGSHSFNDELDYRIKVLLSDLLTKKAKKAKKENEEFEFVQDDDTRKMALFIKVYGTLDNPKFAYDKVGLTDKIKDDIKTEKTSLKSMLKDEFGFFKNDTTVKTQEKIVKPAALQFEWEENKKEEKKEEKKPKNKFEKKEKTNFDKLIDKIAGPENKNEYEDADKYD